MRFPNNIYTVESVLKGHPDKICDQISDGLLDIYLENDSESHVAIECLGTGNTLFVAGEVSSNANVEIEPICQNLYRHITGFSNLEVRNFLSKQSNQLVNAINNGGAGDQGIMYGYACNTYYNYLPYGYWLVNTLAKRLDLLREETSTFLPDGKLQAIISNDEVVQLTINVQHLVDTDMERLCSLIQNRILFDVDKRKVVINPDHGFIQGGFDNDTGLTGRKLMVDTYGGLAPHGGGAFSGKDPSKVDRSAAYMCRFVAKNLVSNGLAKECCVSVSYNFGEENPAMVCVTEDGEESEIMTKYVKEKFDFRPQAIIERLNLKKTKYLPTATYGHFTDPSYPWEVITEL